MKDSFYFPHDYHARHDEKMLFIKSKYGMIGYGIYWILVEMMHEQDDGKLTCNLLDGISTEYNVDITLLKQFYNDAIKTKLFITDNNKYWSARVIKNKKNLELKRRKRSNAGKIGMAHRWGKKAHDNNVITMVNNKSKVKESKVKEIVSDADFLEHLKTIYTWVDLPTEFKKIDAWVLANPQRKKTRRFIINWLNRIDKPMNTQKSIQQLVYKHPDPVSPEDQEKLQKMIHETAKRMKVEI